MNATGFAGRALGFLRRHISGGGDESPELTWYDATDGPRSVRCVPDTLSVGSTVAFGGYDMPVRIRLRVTREDWSAVFGADVVDSDTYLPDASAEAPASGKRITFQGRSLRVASVDVSPCSSFYSLACIDGPKERAEMGIDIAKTDDSGGGNGTATATVYGGVRPLRYQWTGGLTGASVTDLAAGSYTLTVTDCDGNTATKTIVINEV